MDRIQEIHQRISEHLGTQDVVIRDDSHLHAGHAGAKSGGGHFAVKIISEHFNGKTLLDRHRMVYKILDDLMPEEIHALSIEAITPEEKK